MNADMRKTMSGLIGVLGILLASQAHAQFANRSLGGGLGFVKLFGGATGEGSTGVEFAVPLTLEGTLYIENGFDIFAHVPLMLVSVTLGAATASKAGLVFGTGGHLGVRYLFSEETIRPYVGVEIAGFALLTTTTVVFVGPGVVAGIDFFLADTVSVGARGFFDLFIELNVPVRPAFGGGASVAVYF